MKVIREGKPPQDRTYEVTCNNCDCVFEFQAKEARYQSDQRDGDYLQIGCPTCRNNVTVAVKR